MQQQQELDRSSLIGIVLITILLGVWMVWQAPQPPAPGEGSPADSVQADSSVVTDQGAIATDPAEADRLSRPTDSLFAASTQGEGRDITVVSDRFEATFSTKGGTFTSLKLLSYNRGVEGAAEQAGPVELVSTEGGALAVGFTPPRGGFVDTRSLIFRPIVDGQLFTGDTLRIEEGARSLWFEAPVGEGAIRLAYSIGPDSYDFGFRVAAPGTPVLSSGYELMWDGALPFAEARLQDEVAQGGAYVKSGGETESIRLEEPGEVDPMVRSGSIDWVAVKNKFFIAALIPEPGVATEGAELTGRQVGTVEGDSDAFAQDYTVRLQMTPLSAGQADSFDLYLGPLEVQRLTRFGLYDTVDFGFGGFITQPIARYLVAPVFGFLGGFLPNYGLVIILFALIVKVVLWPLTSISYRSAARMREVQPQMEAIKERHADDPQKQQEAMMKLYREEGVNPLGGCLPMLLQYPLLIALWRFFQSTLVLRQESFLWAADLSAPDPILHLPVTIPFYGDYMAGFTLLMGLAMIFQIRLSSGASASMGGQQKILMYVLPGVFLLFFNQFPSGLSLYYLAFNIFSIAQQQWVNATISKESGAKTGGGGSSNGRAKPSSNGRPSRPKKATT